MGGELGAVWWIGLASGFGGGVGVVVREGDD